MSEYQRCPACNQSVPANRQFCDFCGTKLTNTVETTISYPTIKQENTVVTETNNIQENSVEETPKANTEENKKPYNNTNNQDEKHNTRKVFIIAAIVIAVLTGVTLIVGNQIDKKNKKQILDYYYSTLKPKNYSEIELNEELQENNFTKKYIDYLFEKANVKYEENARTIAQELFDSNHENVNLDEISSELRLRKFTAEQITYAISNIDWNKYLTTQTTNFILYENGKVDEVYLMLSEKGFPDDITYDFINSYDWDGLASKCLEQYMQSNKKKTPTEIKNYLYDFRFSKDVVEHALESVDYNSLAEQLAKDYINKNIASDISPFKIKSYLQNEGFNGEQIDKAINSIDFYQYAYQHATDFASSTLKDQGSISRSAVQDNLSRFENYSTSVIEKVISNMDWKHYAYQTTLYFKNCNESKGRIIQLLENYGYTSSEITYATEKIDWKVHCKTILEVDGLNKTNAQEKLERLGFDQSEIEYAIKTTNWNQKALAYAKDLESKLNIITKRDVEVYLEDDGYSSSEIKYAINGLNINWNEQAYSFLLYELERSPGISFDTIRDLLQDENFTSAEINYAFNKYTSEHPAE